jgi:hypothetical protein
MEWCEWVGINIVECDVNLFTPFHGITKWLNVTLTHSHHSME